MVKLLVATRSPGKQREFRRLLAESGWEIAFPDDAGIVESSAEEGLELGESFQANARAKAEYFARRTGLVTVAEDSGLEVFALGGAPGVRSKRWSGADGPPDAVDRANVAMLLQRLTGAPETKRRARYRAVIVLLRTPDAVPEVFEGLCNGRILEAPVGTEGFGYDPVFYADQLGKGMGEASPEEKDAVSHRGAAVRSLLAALGPPAP